MHAPARSALATIALVAATLTLASATPASAAVGRAVIAGPSAELAIPGNDDLRIDAAPDGTAAIAYRQSVGGVAHVYVSRHVAGGWTAGERVDLGVQVPADPSGRPALAVGNGGRIVVVFSNGVAGNERLYAAVKASAGAPFAATQSVQGDPAGWTDPQLDLAPGGDGYLTVHRANELRAFRVQGASFTSVGPGFPSAGSVLNTADAEPGDMRGAKLAVDASGGAATVVWTQSPTGGEYHLVARRLTGTAPAAIGPIVESSIASFQGHAGTTSFSDMPTVASAGGTTWVGYRAAFTYGVATNIPRSIVRTFDGAAFGTPQTIDGIPAAPTEGSEYPRLAVSGAGLGLGVSYRQLTFGTESSTLAGGAWAPAKPANPVPNLAPGRASVALDANGVGLVSFLAIPTLGAEQVQARISGGTQDGTLVTLSDPAFGRAGAPYISTATGGRALTAFLQTTGSGQARVVVAATDLPVPSPAAANPTEAPGTGTPSVIPTVTRAPTAPLTIEGLAFRAKPVVRGPRLPKLVQAGAPKRNTFSFSLARAATVTLAVAQPRPGRITGGKCGAPKKQGKQGKRCTYDRPLPGRATVQAVAGSNVIRFEGRLTTRRTLPLGKLRLIVTARDAAGATSPTATAPFTLRAPQSTGKR